MQYASRITIDIDSYVSNPRLRVQRAYHGLHNAGAADVEVAISSSEAGYHVVGYFEQPVSLVDQFAIRENLNDDPNRLKMDRQRAARGLPINTTWSHKAGNEGERTVYTGLEEALRHMERTRQTDYTRMKTLQNHGRKALRDTEIPHTKAISGT